MANSNKDNRPTRLLDGLRQRLQPVHHELLGLGLIVLAVITLLTLLSVTSGILSDSWAHLLRLFFGWGAIPVSLGIGWIGVGLVVDRSVAPAQAGAAQGNLTTPNTTPVVRWDFVVAIESLIVIGLTLVHFFAGGENPLAIAQAGEGGGLVGWAISDLFIRVFGDFLAGTIIVIATLAVVALAAGLLSGQAAGWIRHAGKALRQGVVSGTSRADGREGPADRQPTMDVTQRRRKPQKPKVSAELAQVPVRSEREKPSRTIRRANHLPSHDLLVPPAQETGNNADARYQAQIIEDTLQGFGVPAKVREINVGPTVTQFGVEPGYIERQSSDGEVHRHRVRVSKITALVNDLALALAAAPIRIEAPVPGRPVVGIEVPNSKVSLVSLRGMLESEPYRKAKGELVIPIGRDVSGKAIVADLATMPHLLIAGATGSGKSVCINAIVAGLLFDHTPDDLKLLMIDPKMVELIGYGGLPHLLAPVIVDLDQVVGALAWVTRLMDERYRLFSEMGVRNIKEHNKKVGRQRGRDPLPHLIVIIDELADLMMMAPEEVERYITRIAQMARATGIHMIIATQRPSVDVVTGLIKANFPARVAFAVTSQIDSRVILDTPGAERLLGRGDCLLMLPDSSKLRRLQGCFVSDQEIHQVVDFWKTNYGELPATISRPWDGILAEAGRDDMFDAAVEVVKKSGRASTTHLQRQLGIGYPRAARIMDQLEEEGIVGPGDGSHPRDVLLDPDADYNSYPDEDDLD